MKCLKYNKENIEEIECCAFCGTDLNDICSSCGKSDDKDLNKSKKRGEKLFKADFNNDLTKRGNRIVIKKRAKEKKKMCIILSFILMFCTGLLLLFIYLKIRENVIYAKSLLVLFTIYIFLVYIINFGIIMACIEISRGKIIHLRHVLTFGFKNIKGLIRIAAVNIMFTLCLFIISLFPVLGLILLFAFAIYTFPVLIIFKLLQCDKKQENISLFGGLKKAFDLCKGMRIYFYGLLFSFVPLFLLGTVLLILPFVIYVLSTMIGNIIIEPFLFIFLLNVLLSFIIFIWTISYIMISIASFYRMLTKEDDYDGNEKGISNLLIITFGFAVILILIILLFVLCDIIKLVYKPMPILNSMPVITYKKT